MREDNLLCLRKRRFVVTTDSAHWLPVYPNLAGEMILTGIDQLWIADITYIRLEVEFVSLAVVLDAYSRRVIGWALGRTLEATLTLKALDMALGRRRPALSLVHHSDRGMQYASGDYAGRLSEELITADPLPAAIHAFMRERTEEWRGTAQQLLAALQPLDASGTLKKMNAHAIGRRTRNIQNLLSRQVSIEFMRNGDGTRQIKLRFINPKN